VKNIVELSNIKKDYQLGTTVVNALKGINLTIQEGDFLSIIGASGSGKTTLLNLIGCIDCPTEGNLQIGGKHVCSMKDDEVTNLRLNKIGFIFQTFNLIPVLNVTENVEFPLLLMNKFTKDEIKARSEKLINEVGLKNYVKHKPYELSGGQRQRVAIARALITNPDIILADEPTANLDSVTGESILELMKELNEVEKTTFIFSTHDANVLKYAKTIIKIKDGLIVD
jgi:putative ABC transport system ATP-binding protein